MGKGNEGRVSDKEGRGIYVGLALSEPLFQEVGEAFLKKVLPGYNKTDYTVTLFKGILRRVKKPRKAKMEQGIRDILDGRENKSPEVQGVLLERMVDDYLGPFWPESGRNVANGINSGFGTLIRLEFKRNTDIKEIISLVNKIKDGVL